MAGYDHPAYLTRHVMTVLTTAGANGTSGSVAFPWDIDVHQVVATVVTAGTSASTGHKVFLLSGTSSIGGDVTLTTSTAGVSGTSGDVATKIAQGTLLSVKNGTDATGVARVMIEYNIAPSGTWLGNE